jgi:2-oxoglutarate ferredoxin oxidoreductase subunit alpha
LRSRGCPRVPINDFVIKFANVNGSGSASANRLFARSILRMGVPVASRNIFPSNIQGLPTWYEVRVSEAGYQGRRGGVDIMVAMNPQTWDADVSEIEPGGYLFYDSTRTLPPSRFREDITLVGVPLSRICAARYKDLRQRQLFKNIVYVGALASLLGIDHEVVCDLIREQFKRKEKLIDPNLEALAMGRDYAQAELSGAIDLKVQRADAVGDRIFLEGNNAAGLGCVYGGATVAAWYPITPSTSLVEAFAKHCNRYRVDKDTGKKRFASVQAEDELASIGMVIGASWNGARAFTATAGPGISLMQEFIGLAYFAEIPAVVFDVQRGGPSTGMPTRTQQSDILTCAYASHGDTKHILLLPEDPRESFEFAVTSFDLADRLQTPIFVMMDLDIGMNEWLCKPLEWDAEHRYDRGKVLSAEELESASNFGRYVDSDGDGIGARTMPGTHPSKGAFFTRGTSHDRHARYSEEGEDYVENVTRLLKKLETSKRYLPAPVVTQASKPTKIGAIYYGSTSPAMSEALDTLGEKDIRLDTLRLRAFPFHDEVLEFALNHEYVFMVEQNRDAQMRTLIINECSLDPARIIPILHYDGTPITARFITEAIAASVGKMNKISHMDAAE